MKFNKNQNTQKNTIAVFGSAFNPPHCGHQDVIRQALKLANRVLLVPSFCHAFGKQMAPFEQRLNMAKAMASSIEGPGYIKVSDIERKLSENKTNNQAIYTYDVLDAIEVEHPDSTLIFILGPDNAAPETWNKFYRAQDIMDRWSVWEAKERVAVRSTKIRNNLAQGILPTETECPIQVIELLKNNR